MCVCVCAKERERKKCEGTREGKGKGRAANFTNKARMGRPKWTDMQIPRSLAGNGAGQIETGDTKAENVAVSQTPHKATRKSRTMRAPFFEHHRDKRKFCLNES